MKKLGMIVRMDKSGLGIQTRRLARMMKPDRLMVIDSTRFNGNSQYPEWYDEYETTIVDGFPTDNQVREFVYGMDKVLTCETFYNNRFTDIAHGAQTETIIVANPEFFDWFTPGFRFVRLPDKIVVPSPWMLDSMYSRFGAKYIPTPIFDDEFAAVRKYNLKQSGRKFLFMNGKTAAEDRNGLEDLYAALEVARGDFTVTIKAQHDIKKHPDPRIIYDFSNPEDQTELYKGFDCLIQPRRYGGQTLSMTEALTCAMPVIMTDVDPNNKILPHGWLLPYYKKGELQTRILLDVYGVERADLAHMLDTIDLGPEAKQRAVELSTQYNSNVLRPFYEGLMQ